MKRENAAEIGAIVFAILVVLVILAFVPLVSILAINIVFDTEVEYSFTNWFWMLVLLLTFGNYRFRG